MNTVFKYELQTTDMQVITMPQGSRPLHVALQNGIPHLWVLVNPENPPEAMTICVHGTGHAVRPQSEYVGTYEIGPLVFHVFY